jgi:hypothetical protein
MGVGVAELLEFTPDSEDGEARLETGGRVVIGGPVGINGDARGSHN